MAQDRRQSQEGPDPTASTTAILQLTVGCSPILVSVVPQSICTSNVCKLKVPDLY